MIPVILIFSFLFESSFSNIINTNSFFIPLFLITSLTILYPYFKNKKTNFIIVCLICGLFYDVIFLDSVFINTLSFGLIGLLIMFGYNYINYNIYNANIINIIIIIFYRFVGYLLLCIVDYVSFNENVLMEGIYNSLLINIIYGIILYLIVDLIAKIFNLKRID